MIVRKKYAIHVLIQVTYYIIGTAVNYIFVGFNILIFIILKTYNTSISYFN